MDKKLFLIDGHALIFKMYYAFLRHPMINSKGADMSVLFGFTKYILELIEKEKPTHLAIAFDPPGGTFRHEMYPEYKGTRSETRLTRWKQTQNKVQKAKCFFTAKRVNIILNVKFKETQTIQREP